MTRAARLCRGCPVLTVLLEVVSNGPLGIFALDENPGP